MPREWTIAERRKFLRAKYFTRRSKVLCTIIFLLAVFAMLWVTIAGVMNHPTVQAASMIIVIIIIVIFFLVLFGMTQYKRYIWALIFIGIILSLSSWFLTYSSLGGIEQFVAVVALGLIFLLVLGISMFMIDLHNFEGE